MKKKAFYFTGIFSFFLFLSSICFGSNAEISISNKEENKRCKKDSVFAQTDQTSFLQVEDQDMVKKDSGAVKASHPEEDEISRLSFNFIYYVIYKFKYIEDIFGLSESKENNTKASSSATWY